MKTDPLLIKTLTFLKIDCRGSRSESLSGSGLEYGVELDLDGFRSRLREGPLLPSIIRKSTGSNDINQMLHQD